MRKDEYRMNKWVLENKIIIDTRERERERKKREKQSHTVAYWLKIEKWKYKILLRHVLHNHSHIFSLFMSLFYLHANNSAVRMSMMLSVIWFYK